METAEGRGVVDVSAYEWIGRFDEGGPASLYDQKRERRRPRKAKGYSARRRMPPQLARHLEEGLGVEVHPDTVRRAMRRLQYSWKRPRRVYRRIHATKSAWLDWSGNW